MPAMAAPLASGKLDAWEAWSGELTCPRRAEFEAMNQRHGLTEHRAYLQPLPDGNYLVLVVVEGDAAAGFLPSVAQSDHDLDRSSTQSVVDLHEFEMSGPMPPMANRSI